MSAPTILRKILARKAEEVARGRAARSLSTLEERIREQDAPTPSRGLRQSAGTATRIAPLHATDEASLVRQLHGDLDWICLKALEKDPARRYASASPHAQA